MFGFKKENNTKKIMLKSVIKTQSNTVFFLRFCSSSSLYSSTARTTNGCTNTVSPMTPSSVSYSLRLNTSASSLLRANRHRSSMMFSSMRQAMKPSAAFGGQRKQQQQNGRSRESVLSHREPSMGLDPENAVAKVLSFFFFFCSKRARKRRGSRYFQFSNLFQNVQFQMRNTIHTRIAD